MDLVLKVDANDIETVSTFFFRYFHCSENVNKLETINWEDENTTVGLHGLIQYKNRKKSSSILIIIMILNEKFIYLKELTSLMFLIINQTIFV